MKSFLCILIAIGIFIVYINIEKMSKWWMAIPMLAIIPSLYLQRTGNFLEQYYLNIILSFALITYTTGKSIINRKINNIYLFASAIYLLLSIISFEMNTYVNLLLILFWSVVHWITYEHPDVFKIISYITGLVIYYILLTDIGGTSITVAMVAGALACTYLITRTVLKKYISWYKILEYIATSIIYFEALFMCYQIPDAMIFIAFLIILVVFGYIKKVGPLFLVSLIAIVVNIFKLTKDFWQSIPWWVYMLVVGSALITFAIRNEINEKEEKIRFGDIIQKLKNNVDL